MPPDQMFVSAEWERDLLLSCHIKKGLTNVQERICGL